MSCWHSSYILLLLSVLLATSGHGACLCRQDQSAALLRIKSSFRSYFGTSNLSSWKVNTDCCTWEGITCDGMMGHVTALDVSELRIFGNLSSDIFSLTSLRFLSLADNYFDGSPWSSSRGFEKLPHLKYLNLSDSGLSGYVPVENGQLANLVTLDLSSLDLKILSLDALINNLGSLQILYLNYVTISVSPIRSTHASFTNTTPRLRELCMKECTITGRIDTSLSNLRFLTKLTLDFSTFSDPIHVLESLAASSSLVVLSLPYCGLIGTFPSRIFHIKSLTVLDVSGNENLYGKLPEFMQDSALEHLIISGTKFSGQIPESISNLRNLSRMDLSNCQFHGLIPSFAPWPKIRLIDLSRNNLTGSLHPDGYLALQNLTTFHLGYNSISGEIPASLFSHPSLQNLDLSQNNFTGNFLLYHNISSNLREIDVSNNKLQGPIPKLLSKFVGLEVLDLSSNNLTGTVALSLIKNYKNLTGLLLSNNRLSIEEEDSNHSYAEYPSLNTLSLASCNLMNVPKFLMHQKGVFDLDLSNNHIAGHIPDWIWRIGEDFIAVNLSHNIFTSVQTNLSNVPTHDLTLDLSSNKIEGALPLPPRGTAQLDYSNNHFNSSVITEFWSHVTGAWFLSLSNNSLIGELPHSICNATYIQVLDLSFNSFSGLIPPCLYEDNKNLTILNLRGNNFHGPFPQNIGKECALTAVDLNGNQLEGKLPVSLINCRMLQVLDLGNNQIMDTFPEWVGILPLLKVLVLRSNRFHGHIDHRYGKDKQMHSIFPALQVLDLSSNNFNGSIPTRFLKKLKAMMVASFGPPSMHYDTISQFMYIYYYKNLVTVMQKGLELTIVNILPIFTTLDLSNNNFEGIIPNEIGGLKSLKGLNLSRNSFIGGIPPRIANMLQLESMDLSYNQLSGKIPPEMALLVFLEVLNLSYNHLSGPIPHSNQFLTFQDTSFLGNDGLCGKPLPRPCNPNHAQPAAATPRSSTEVNWDILSIEVGVVCGLAIVVATTLLWGDGRRCACWHVDKFLLRVLRPWIRHHHH